METTQRTVNGFKPEDITATINALKEDPALAKFQWRARNKWISGGHNRSRIQDFYGGGKEDASRTEPFVVDNAEPPILLGNNEGPNPVEFILHGLAGCMTTTMVLHAAAHGISIDSVETSLTGDWDAQGFLGLDENVRNGYQQVNVNFKIEGDLTEEQKEQLISFAKKSPVYDIVTHGVPVKVGLQEAEAVI
ncbi:OsmC family protein [Pontibacter saemangeumensis]|uniref:OsmC family protein n=1 Tax=Pontibacter saemangeumensis TaxID=1084525 RepID=A0ABP8LIY7_9BACT